MSDAFRPQGAAPAPLTPLGALAAGFGLMTLAGAVWAQAAPQAAACEAQAAASAPAAAAVPGEDAASAPAAVPQPAPAAVSQAASAAVPEAASGPVDAVLPRVTVRGEAEPQGKETLNPGTTTTGKGKQAVRDIPQSMTTVTERLIDDRNLDTLKKVLRNTAGVTFQAAEGGEEDIRLRGFSLAATGDIYVDGIRDPAFYDRDTFNDDRIDLLRGSASMLFGRGSTGGVANQVSKQPMLIDQHEVGLALGSGKARRLTGDFNLKTGEDSAVRLNVMSHAANVDGLRTDKKGLAAAWRTGIGTADELLLNIYTLTNHNGINYGLPWAGAGDRRVIFSDTTAYYGMASDYNAGGANWATASHTHRFGQGAELKTSLRYGHFKRDQRASTVRFVQNNVTADTLTDATALRRGTNNKVQDMTTAYFQSDYSQRFEGLGLEHQVLAGVDAAHEDFVNYNMNLPAGVTLTKPNTSVGATDDGAWVDESLRVRTPGRTFTAIGLGAYGQDMVKVATDWKVLAGLRYDRFKGRYTNVAGQAGQTPIPAGTVYAREDGLWSKRLGLLFQPSPQQSYHLSWGTSFNTSGDTYQYDSQTSNTPPESSENLEIGARLDNAAKTFTTRMAVFRSVKLHERNRDPDSAASQNVLSGKRHTAGFELDLTGRLTPDWEVFGSYAYTPVAKIDVGAPGCTPGVGECEGTRSALTPRHAGTVWSTYQLAASWRVGAGLNARSSMTPNRNPAGIVAPRWVTGDLMAEYAPTERVRLKLDVVNVTDKFYADTLYTGHYVQGAPRTVTLTGTYKF